MKKGRLNGKNIGLTERERKREQIWKNGKGMEWERMVGKGEAWKGWGWISRIGEARQGRMDEEDG
jgi:hypothetical protein